MRIDFFVKQKVTCKLLVYLSIYIHNAHFCGKIKRMGFFEGLFAKFRHAIGVPITFFSFTGDCNTPPVNIRFNEFSGARTSYNKCSPISTIVNRLSSSMANGKWWIVDDNNNDVSGRFKNVYEILQNPNPLQSLTDFIKQVDIYRNLYGVSYVYAVTPAGFRSTSDAVALWPVNPERIEAIYRKDTSLFNSRKISDIIEKYIITVDNSRIDVIPEHILCIKDAGLDVIDKSNSHSSRIEGLQYEIKNIIQAQEAIYSLNKDRGAQGILSNKTRDAGGSIPLTPREKEQIQKEYQEKYGLSVNQSKVLISDADLQWQQMSFSIRDLMLFEGIKQNIESITDAFNYPFELLANQKGTTFANKSEAVKFLYQDNIIPASKIYAEKFTRFFGIQNAKIDIDFSDIEYLKEAEKEKADALLRMNQALQISYKLGIITMEEYRKALDLDEKPTGTIFYSDGNKTEETATTNQQGTS